MLFNRKVWLLKARKMGAIFVGISGIFSAGWAVYVHYSPPETIEKDGTCQNKSQVQAIIHWHENAKDYDDAKRLEKIIRATGAATKLTKHRDPRPADSFFIDYGVGICLARIAILNAPHEIAFLFRPDYSAEDGSGRDGEGTIGIGYRSTWFAGDRQDSSEPLRVTPDIIQYLIEPGISDAEFNRRLRSITGVI